MSKIYDCFNFFNELDILELRLNTLYDHVDFFVIVESDVTHSGEPKKFFYEEHRERFSKFADKILNYKILIPVFPSGQRGHTQDVLHMLREFKSHYWN